MGPGRAEYSLQLKTPLNPRTLPLYPPQCTCISLSLTHTLTTTTTPCTGSQLGVIDTSTSTLTPLDTGFTSFSRLAVTGPGLTAPEGDLTIVTVAGSASKGSAVVQLKVCSVCVCVGWLID